MYDNKKLGHKIGSIVWWVITLLPLILALIYFVGYHLTFNSGISSGDDLQLYHENGIGSYWYYLENTFTLYTPIIPTFILGPIRNIFSVVFGAMSSNIACLMVCFAWAVWVQLIHIVFDLLCWVPNLCHKLINKFGGVE